MCKRRLSPSAVEPTTVDIFFIPNPRLAHAAAEVANLADAAFFVGVHVMAGEFAESGAIQYRSQSVREYIT